MEKQQPLKDWIQAFNNGSFESNDVKVQINAGWYDWFCKDSSLKNKTKRMGTSLRKLNQVAKLIWKTVMSGLKTTVHLKVIYMMILELQI